VAESISAELLLTRKKINTEANNPQIPFMPLALFLKFSAAGKTLFDYDNKMQHRRMQSNFLCGSEIYESKLKISFRGLTRSTKNGKRNQ
jgi:hypothetical protein